MAYTPKRWFDRIGNPVALLRGSDLDRIEQGVASNDAALPDANLTPVVGNWYVPGHMNIAGTSNTLGDQNLRVFPVLVRRKTIIDRLSVAVTVAGSAGAVVRLGIYKDRGDGYPGDLLVDAGTVSATAVANPSATVAATLTPGVWWFAACPQGAPTTAATIGTGGAPVSPIPLTYGASAPGSGNVLGYIQGSVAGSLPATFSTTVTTTGSMPRVSYRVA